MLLDISIVLIFRSKLLSPNTLYMHQKVYLKHLHAI